MSLASLFVRSAAGQAQNILSPRLLTTVSVPHFSSKAENPSGERCEIILRETWTWAASCSLSSWTLWCGSIQTNYWPVFRKMDHEKFTMVGVDPVGFGKSHPPNRNPFTNEFCLKRDARFAGDVMENLGYNKYSVVGWSNGGISATTLPGLREENLISIVVCNAPMRTDARLNLCLDQMIHLKNWDVRHRRDLLRVYEKGYAVKILNDWRHFIKREHEQSLHSIGMTTAFLNFLRLMMFIYGTQDTFTNPVDAVENFSEYPSFFQRRLFRNGTHSHLDFVDEFVDLVSEFLEDQEVESVVR